MDAGTVPYGYGGPMNPPRPATKLDLAAIIRDGWVLFAKDWVALVVGLLIAGFLGLVTLGILLPVLSGGIYKMILRRVREGRPAEIGDVFSCFDRFGPLFVFALIMLAIVVLLFGIAFAPLLLAAGMFSGDSNSLEAIGVGAILLTVLLFFVVTVVLFYLQVIWVYVYQVIIDRRAGLGEALSQSRRLVMANGFWWHVLALIVISAIVSVVTFPIGILNNLTFGLASVLYVIVVPFQITCYLSMYFQVSGERHLLPSAFPGVPMAAYQGGGRVSAPPQWGAPGAAPYGGPVAPWQAGPAMPPPYGTPGPPPYGPPGPPPYGPPPPPAPTAVGEWGPPPAPPTGSDVPPAPEAPTAPSAPTP